jgi:hypothetical protein
MARKSSRRTASPTKPRRAGQRRSAGAFYSDILSVAGTLFRNRQQAGADKIGLLSAAARNFAADLIDIPNIQSYAHAAADQMETLGDYVADNSMERIAEDAMAIAKRHPVATAAFAVAVGFGFTRLMTHNGLRQGDETPMPATRTARKGAVKRSAPKKRAVVTKAKANGHAAAHERVNAA